MRKLNLHKKLTRRRYLSSKGWTMEKMDIETLLEPVEAAPEIVESNGSRQVLHSVPSEKVYGASLMRVASGFRYVDGETKASEVALEFQKDADLHALGVCNAEGFVQGLITRSHLFGLLGKPFGREVIGKKPIGEVAEKALCFDKHANLFQVAEQLQSQIDRATIHYFLLSTQEGRFAALFSSKDLLLYLSRITQEDIVLAGQLQERLVKGRESLSQEFWQIEGLSQSAKGLGGDFYHVIEFQDGRVFLTLGDVSGKGVAASILTSLLWGVLEFFDYRKGLKALILQLNEALIRTFHLEKYLTGVFALYDPSRKEILYSDMGHGHAWILRNGKPRTLRFPSMNLPLGIDQGLNPQVYRFKVKPGDLLCFYTDGMTEQVNEAGEEWGETAVLDIVRSRSKQPQEIPEALIQGLNAHQGLVPRLDDVTWLQLAAR